MKSRRDCLVVDSLSVVTVTFGLRRVLVTSLASENRLEGRITSAVSFPTPTLIAWNDHDADRTAGRAALDVGH